MDPAPILCPGRPAGGGVARRRCGGCAATAWALASSRDRRRHADRANHATRTACGRSAHCARADGRRARRCVIAAAARPERIRDRVLLPADWQRRAAALESGSEHVDRSRELRRIRVDERVRRRRRVRSGRDRVELLPARASGEGARGRPRGGPRVRVLAGRDDRDHVQRSRRITGQGARAMGGGGGPAVRTRANARDAITADPRARVAPGAVGERPRESRSTGCDRRAHADGA